MNKYIATLAFAIGLAGSFGTVAFADTATSTATTTSSHIKGGVSPYYFFHELGITTTIDAAEAVWQDGHIRQFIMEVWRKKFFGY